jgi:hypothetical protein
MPTLAWACSSFGRFPGMPTQAWAWHPTFRNRNELVSAAAVFGNALQIHFMRLHIDRPSAGSLLHPRGTLASCLLQPFNLVRQRQARWGLRLAQEASKSVPANGGLAKAAANPFPRLVSASAQIAC